MKRWIALAAFSALALTMASCTISKFINYRSSPDNPQYGGEVKLNGLQKPVKVVFDGHLVPHVTAENDTDLAFAMGYLHARERLFQMDLLRRIACGRLSEMFGDRPRSATLAMASTLAVDRWFRIQGLCRAGDRLIDKVAPEAKKTAEAYAAGVNEYIRTGTLPIEYRLLETAPEMWAPRDTMAVARLNGYFLSVNAFHELIRYLIRLNLGTDAQQEIFPAFDQWGPPIVDRADKDYRIIYPKSPKPEEILPESRIYNDPSWAGPAAGIIGEIARMGEELRQFMPPEASNNWAVAGNRSESGKPIVANDPHLQHTAPGVFYMMNLITPTQNVAGVTMPGTPAVVIGHNLHVAWGLTTTMADTQDVYLEKLDPKDPTRYLTRDGSEPFRLLTEKIRERLPDGKFKEHDLVVRFTRHGVVINDAMIGMLPKDAPPLAMKTAMDEPSDELYALLRIARAGNVAEFKKALSTWGTPLQNWVVGDDAGHLMYLPAGNVPIRRGWDGTMPVPGWTGEFEWQGYIPRDELPQLMDPPSGVIVTANNKVVPMDDYPYPFSIDASPGYRATRIRDMLVSREKWNPEAMRRLQIDVYVKQADRLLPALIEAIKASNPSGKEEQAFKVIASWDRQASIESVGAAIYFSTYKEAREITLRDKLPGDLYDFISSFGYMNGLFDRLWADMPNAAVFDVRSTARTETRDDVLRLAFKRAVENLASHYGNDVAGWTWGRIHNIEFTHTFGERKELRSTFNYGPFPHPGARDTVFMAEGHWNPDYTFTAAHGPAFRQVVDLASPGNAGMIVDLGQSGWPVTEGYSNGYQDWRAGRAWTVNMDEKKFSAEARGTLVLKPVN
jgi:penicillin amidase